ncbi:MAG TPA: sigma factor-like helix-turn-helix DNA-binding protein, partial [Polyangiaceae bacterium]|nr:sigma factor-like helix-turn-helix DNA-binding protein [Polyangiaceae bacterium]
RESVALAFVALLQKLPPKPRAVLLLKDVVGFSVQEIAAALELSPQAVASALHRARAHLAAAPPRPVPEEPPPATVAEFVRCWEQRDLTGLLALLRDDVVLSMPPFPAWFQGREEVGRFFQTERFEQFWSSGLRLVQVRANGQLAVLYYRDRGTLLHSVQLTTFDGRYFTHLPTFIGPAYLAGFA